ncbi:T9SS type B sorting domain-containing protein [Aureivirga sp. CE67]|uniref:T9SS type B sorting domain-containing protein n=1 Tax=Aureivirga sp. CE67 TaxID=1788983 RepID=UPI0018CB82BA|nr:T9SS type B sorting domain-containing protein [Aureivirga sp. CE67]
MMKKPHMFVVLLFLCIQVFAQKQSANWYFGSGAGLDFSSGIPIPLSNSSLSTSEGCSAISDENGDLIFYTDGIRVWDKTGNEMANGGIALKGHISSTQSSIVVPKPEDPNIYYIFTVDQPHTDPTTDDPDGSGSLSFKTQNNGLNYTVIDLQINGGLGGIDNTQKNIHLTTYDTGDSDQVFYKCSEKITAIRHNDCESFWVVTHFVDTFYAFRVTSSGVTSAAVTSVTTPSIDVDGYYKNAVGYMKISPDGSRLAIAHFGDASTLNADANGSVYLYDFDNATGTVSNPTLISNADSPYGIEFSPDSTKLYTSVGKNSDGKGGSILYQYDLENSNTETELYQDNVNRFGGALQLALDQKIYYSIRRRENISVINNPNVAGLSSGFSFDAVVVDPDNDSKQTELGLPPFIQSLFGEDFIDIIHPADNILSGEIKINQGSSYTLYTDAVAGYTYEWTKDGSPLAESDEDLVVTEEGVYQLTVTKNNGDCPSIGTASVEVIPSNIATQAPTDLFLCDDGDGIVKFFLSNEKDAEILNGLTPSDYKITYHKTQADADIGGNVIADPYDNSVAYTNETIYVRVEDATDSSNFVTHSFEIGVIAITINTGGVPGLAKCDDTSVGTVTDDLVLFDLTENETYILNGLDPNDFTFEYYTDNTYFNLIPDPTQHTNITTSETVFVKVISNVNNSCSENSSFTITINSTLTTPVELSACDENGDGEEKFNLEDAVGLFVPDPNAVTVRYYESMADLNSGTNHVDPADYAANDGDNVWILASGTNCHAIGTLTLNINSLPIGENVTEYKLCDDDADPSDGILATIDFSSKVTEVLGSLDPNDYEVTFHSSAADAQDDTGALSDPFTNTSTNEVIHIRLENKNTGCADTTKNFDLTIHENTYTLDFSDYELCDDNYDGIVEFDLENFKADEIAGGDSSNLNITYYLTQTDAENQTNQITQSPFENTVVNEQTIYVRVEDNLTNCELEINSFKVIVNPLPPFGTIPPELILCDNDDDGDDSNGIVQTFDIHALTPDVLDGLDPNDYTVTYHNSSYEARNNLNPIPAGPFANDSPYFDSVYIRLENNDTGCAVRQLLDLIVKPNPDFDLDAEAFLCPDGDLTLAPDNVNDPDATFQWFDKDDILIASTETVVVTTLGTYTLKVKNDANCVTTKTIEVKSHPAVAITTIPNIEVCDDDNDGFALFDLVAHFTTIEGNYALGEYTIKAYESITDAQSDSNEITASNYQNSSANSMTIFTKIINNTTGCENHDVTFNLIVNPIPVIPAVVDLELCDDDKDGLVSGFFIQDFDNQILFGLTNHDVTYHTSQADADSDSNPIINKTNFTNTVANTQTIYIRLENNDSGCYSTSTFDLIVNPLPTFDLDTSETLCPGETLILSPSDLSDPSATFEWSDNSNTLGTDKDLAVTTAGDYTFTMTDTNGCVTSETVTVTMHPDVAITAIPDIELCDDDTDGFLTFDIQTHIDNVEGNYPPGDYTVKAYPTQSDMQSDTNEITNNNAYQNTSVNSQIIYTHITNNNTGCTKDDVTFQIIVNPYPTVLTVADIELCDDDTDGLVSGFNLQDYDVVILAGLSNHDVTYHTSLADAQTDANAITNVSNFTNTVANTQTIYIRLENDPTGCYNTGSFDLIVNPLPTFDIDSPQSFCPGESIILSPTNISDPSATFEWFDSGSNSISTNKDLTVTIAGDYTITITDTNGCQASETVTVNSHPVITVTQIPDIEVCDDNNDGFEIFDLISHLNGVGGSNYTIKAYESLADAQGDTNEITSATYQNTVANTQTIYTSITDNNTGCSNTDLTFDLIINASPTVIPLPTLELCDDDTDGFVSGFDLTPQIALVILPGHSVSFHYSENGALNNTDGVPGPLNNFTNTVANQQTLYIRLVNINEGCMSVLNFDVVVNPLPTFDLDSPQNICPNGSLLLEPTNLSDPSATFVWADNSNTLGTDKDLLVTAAGDYTFTMTDSNGCSTSQTVTVTEFPPIAITTIPNIEVCDDDTDGFAVFDIEAHMDAVEGNYPPGEYTVKAYPTQSDLQNDTNEITNNSAYTNATANQQTIYTNITNNTTGCETEDVTFEIIVNPLPTVVTLPNLELCDDDYDGFVSGFNLQSQDATILGSLTDHDVTYHTTLSDAQSDLNPITNVTNFTNTVANTQTIYVRLENDPTGCSNTGSFDLVVNPLPNFDLDTPQTLCFGESLDLIPTNIVGTNLTYEWFDSNSNSISTNQNLTVTTPGDYTLTISNLNCSVSQTVTVIESQPIPVTIPDLEVCDDDTDGFASFDLTNHIDNVLGNFNPGEYTIKLYTNQNDAQNETNEITNNPFTNQTANSQTIFTSITNNDTNCTISSVTFDIIVNPLPVIISVPDLELCDDDYDGIVSTFDIHSLSSTILGSLVDHDVTFHLTQADAQNDVNPIPAGNFTNTSNPQTIYIRLENDPTGCSNVGSFNLVVNPKPDFDVISPQQICPNSTVTLSVDNVTSANPIYEWFDSNNNSIGNSATVTVSQEGVYTVVIRNAFDCQTEKTITVIESNQIALQIIPDLHACYDKSDDMTDFDLQSHIATVLTNFNVNEFTVKLYETQNDADNDTNEIDTNNLYTVTGQNPVTIYTNITNNNTGCIVTDVNFELIVDPLPNIPPLDPIILCDDDNDGFMAFDIHAQTAIIYQTLDDNFHTVSYHETLADAESNTNTLTGNYTNTSNPQTIYVRVENTDTNCFDTATFDLIINDSPLFTIPSPQNICPGESLLIGPNSVFGAGTTFEWTDGTNTVIGNSQMLTVTAAGDYTLTVTNGDSCVASQTVTIIMLDAVAITTLPNLEACDDDADGFVAFDLTSHVNDVLSNYNNGEYTITLYETDGDAQNNTNPITVNPYTNTTANQQTIYTNITNNNTGCFVTDVTFDIIVNPLPILPNLDPIALCDDDNDGFMEFDIHLQTAIIFQTLDDNFHTVSYHESLADAQNNVNAIPVGNYTNTSSPQIIYVRVENTDTNCFDTTTFEINVNDSPLFTLTSPQNICPGTTLNLNPDGIFVGNTTFEWTDGNNNVLANTETLDVTDAGDYTLTVTNEDGCVYSQTATVIMLDEVAITTIPTLEVCDDDTDGFAAFDLVSHIDGVLQNYNPGEYTIDLYQTSADAENDTNPITTNPFTNTTVNQQTIYTKITNNNTNCFVTNVRFDIVVNPLPVPVSLPDLITCDNDNDGNNANGIVQDFDVHQNTNFIYANLDPNDYEVSYHETLANAENGANPIPPGNYTNLTNPQTIFIRIENKNTSCIDVSETFELIVDPALTFDLDALQQFCSNESITLSPTNLSDINVTFEWFDSNNNSLATTQDYTTTIPGDYTLVVSRPNCEVSQTVTIEHHPEIQITSLPDLLQCDDDYDGFTDFDLKTHIVDYLDSNFPGGQYTINLFTSQNDADTNTNPIDTNNLFTNTTITNQLIFTNILDNNTGCSITDISFSVVVQELPSIPTITNLELCDDDNDGFMSTFDIHSVTGNDLASFTNHTISYHETENDAQNNTNAIPTGNYTNTVAENQTIWVRVEDDSSNCFAYSSFELFVHKYVEFDLVDEETLCPFSFTTLKVENVSEPTVTYEWTDENGTVIGNTDTITVNQEGTFSVTVSNANCSNTKEIKVRRLADLEITSIPDLLVCDDDYDGFAAFDLDTHIQNVLSNYTPNQYSITLFTSQNDADNDTNPIDVSSLYTNTTVTTQTLYTKVLDNTTGCYNTDVSFNIVVQEIPTLPTIANLELCDDDNDGFMSTFDIHSVSTNDLASFTNHTISYHETENDAQNNANPIPVGNYTNTVAENQTIWVRVEDNANNCPAYTSFELIIHKVVEFDIVGDDKLCQDSFVTLKAENVSETNVTYEWLDETGNPIGNSDTVDVTQIGIYTLNISNQNCTTTKTFEVTAHPLIQITSLPDMNECDDDFDGITEFDLKAHINGFLNANYPNGEYSIDLYVSQNDADNQTNPIDTNNLFTNGTVDSQVIYTNITDTSTGCSISSVNFNIIVEQLPVIPTLSNIEQCDDDFDGIISFFNVHSKTISELASFTNHTISYHETENDAQNNANPIPVGDYTNTTIDSQTIWVRVEDNANGCMSYSSFDLIVNKIVDFDIVGDDKLCQDSFVTLSADNVSETGVAYTWRFETGATLGFGESIDVTQAGTYTLAVEYQNCINSKTFEVTNHPLIQITSLPDMFECDDDYDGITEFDLKTHINGFLNANYPNGEYSIDLYVSQNDADNQTNPIDVDNLFTNTIVTNQTIYTNILDNSTGCSTTGVAFSVVVQGIPSLPTITNLELCDDDNDGFMSTFDVHSVTTNDLASFTNHFITYHETENDAQNNANAIPAGDYTNTVADNQIVWVRVADKDSNCFAYTSFSLIVNNYVEFDIVGDDKLCQDSFVTLSADNVSETSVTYEWKDESGNPIGNTDSIDVTQIGEYTLIVSNQNCSNSKVFTVTAHPEIQITSLPDMTECDDDYDGVTEFDMDSHMQNVLTNYPANMYTIELYTSQSDADNDTNSMDLNNMYSNTSPNSQTIYTRVTDNFTGCYVTNMSFNLNVDAIPVMPTMSSMELCDDDNDGFMSSFNIHSKTNTELSSMTNHTISYHKSENDARNNLDPIPTGNYTNIIPDTQTIWVRVADNDNGCPAYGTFDIIVNNYVEFEMEDEYTLCLNSTLTLEPTNVSDLNATYAWYNESGTVVSTLSTLEITHQGLFTLVVSNANCENKKTFQVNLADPIPLTAIPDMEICDDDNDGFADFTIANHVGTLLQENNITNHIANIYSSYQDALDDTNRITDTVYTNTSPDSQTLFVVIVDPETNCPSPVISFDLNVYETAKVPDFDDLEMCDDAADGIQTFDLNDQNTTIANGINLTTHNVTFHISQEDAESGQNAISIGTYQNVTPNEQEIFVRVESVATGCANTEKSFMLIVNPLPDFEVETPQYICEGFDHLLDIDISNSGSFTYEWMDEDGNSLGQTKSIYIQNAGMYAVTVMSDKGCESSKIIEVHSIDVPQMTKADITIEGTTVTVNVQNQSDTGFEYSLDDIDGDYQTEPYFENVNAGDHIVYVRNQKGCTTISIPFSIMGFPQYFTPNNDGTHDYWQVTGFEENDFKFNKVTIYDRFGKVLSQFNIKSKGWDGTYQGFDLPSSDYWYTINLVTQEGEEINYKGHFSLIRR